MLNEKFALFFNMTIKWDLRKPHASRLKWAKYKTSAIKEILPKWMNNNQMNKSDGLSYGETLILSNQIVQR